MNITDSQAEYLLTLVDDRIDELERRLRVVVTPQEEHEIRTELDRAKGVSISLRR